MVFEQENWMKIYRITQNNATTMRLFFDAFSLKTKQNKAEVCFFYVNRFKFLCPIQTCVRISWKTLDA